MSFPLTQVIVVFLATGFTVATTVGVGVAVTTGVGVGVGVAVCVATGVGVGVGVGVTQPPSNSKLHASKHSFGLHAFQVQKRHSKCAKY